MAMVKIRSIVMVISEEHLIRLKQEFLKHGKKVGDQKLMQDDPSLSPYSFYYFTDDRDPTSDEPDVFYGYPGLIYFWWNTTTLDFFICTNSADSPDGSGLGWEKFATSRTVLEILAAAGWGLNTSRDYAQRSSPAFSTSYTPSATNDTQVIATVSLTSTLLTASEVQVQVNTGSGFVTVAEQSVTGVDATSIYPVTFTVPTSASYQLVSVSGTASIVQIMELSE
jgi:hypothetical protein